ncbi:MAG: type VI secretion system tip protein TssI/VgrG [Planctomycetota bacterium]
MARIQRNPIRFLSGRQIDSTRTIEAEDPLIVRKLVGDEGISQLFRYELELVSRNAALDEQELLQNPATISIMQGVTLAGSESRGYRTIAIHGTVTRLRQAERVQKWTIYHATVRPRMWRLTQYRGSQVWTDLDIRGLIKACMQEAGLEEGPDFEFRLANDYPVREHVVQYNESLYDFISRWMEHEGIIWFVEHGTHGDKVVFADDSSAWRPLLGAPALNYRPAETGGSRTEIADSASLDDWFTEEVLQSLSREQAPQPESVVLRDYNWRNPKDPLEVEHATGVAVPVGRVFHYNEHYRTRSEGDQLATARAQSYAAAEVTWRGSSTARSMQAGAQFGVADHYRPDFNRELAVIRVRHVATQAISLDTGRSMGASYHNEFEAIDAERRFVPPCTTPWPAIRGVMHAHVVSENASGYADIDRHGAYLVRMPYDAATPAGLRGKEASAPKAGTGTRRKPRRVSRRVRFATPFAGDGVGMHFPLRDGTEVLLAHIDGNPDRPVIVGTLHNQDKRAVTAGTDAAANLMRSYSGQLLRFNDTDGHKGITLGNSAGSIQIHDRDGVNGMIMATGNEVVGVRNTNAESRDTWQWGHSSGGGPRYHSASSTASARQLVEHGSAGAPGPGAPAPATSPRVGMSGMFFGPDIHQSLDDSARGLMSRVLDRAQGERALFGAGLDLDDDGTGGAGVSTISGAIKLAQLRAEAGFFAGFDEPNATSKDEVVMSKYARDFATHDQLAEAAYNADADFRLTGYGSQTVASSFECYLDGNNNPIKYSNGSLVPVETPDLKVNGNGVLTTSGGAGVQDRDANGLMVDTNTPPGAIYVKVAGDALKNSTLTKTTRSDATQTEQQSLVAQRVFHGRMAKVLPGKIANHDSLVDAIPRLKEMLQVDRTRRECSDKLGNFPTSGDVESIRKNAEKFSSGGPGYSVKFGTQVSVSEGFSGSYGIGDSKSVKIGKLSQSFSDTDESVSYSVGKTSWSASIVDSAHSYGANTLKTGVTHTGLAFSADQTGIKVGNSVTGVSVSGSETGLSASVSLGIFSFALKAIMELSITASKSWSWKYGTSWSRDYSDSYGETFGVSQKKTLGKAKVVEDEKAAAAAAAAAAADIKRNVTDNRDDGVCTIIAGKKFEVMSDKVNVGSTLKTTIASDADVAIQATGKFACAATEHRFTGGKVYLGDPGPASRLVVGLAPPPPPSIVGRPQLQPVDPLL